MNRIFLRFCQVISAFAMACVLVSPAQAQGVTGNADAAKSKISMCIGCHAIAGYKASFPIVYAVPLIAGQSAKYIENSLQAYRKGDRDHPSMRAVAGSLSDQDIADLAAYYSASVKK
jgi:cytochrome c553